MTTSGVSSKMDVGKYIEQVRHLAGKVREVGREGGEELGVEDAIYAIPKKRSVKAFISWGWGGGGEGGGGGGGGATLASGTEYSVSGGRLPQQPPKGAPDAKKQKITDFFSSGSGGGGGEKKGK